MKRYLRAVWIALLFIISPSAVWAAVGNNIDVQLISHSTEGEVSSSVITVLIRNVGDVPVLVPKPLSPLETPADHLMTNLFSVKNSRGEVVKFIGRFVRVIPDDPDRYFIKISPGQSASKEIDLAKDYDLTSGGTFVVSYDQNYSLGYTLSERGEISSDPKFQKSQEAKVWVSTPAGSVDHHNALSINASEPSYQCTSDQLNTIRVATINAYTLVSNKAQPGITSLFFVKKTKNAKGEDIYLGQLKQDNTYDYWFGPALNDTQPYYFEPRYTDFVSSNDDYVMMGYMRSIALRLGAGSSLCGCDSAYDPRTAAWTDQQNQVVHYCDAFFKLKLSDGPYDSQILTVIHEVSHFIDRWGGGTLDAAYGRIGAHALATSDRTKAVRNADNITYYIGSFNTSSL